MLWIDEPAYRQLIEALCSALLRCKNVEGLLTAPAPSPVNMEAVALGMLSILMRAPVVVEGTIFSAALNPWGRRDEHVRVATWPPILNPQEEGDAHAR